MKELIYNQKAIPKDQWRYGIRSSAATGCGWIATHNALRLMGYEADIPALIRYYTWQLPLIHGTSGTSFWGPAVLFKQWGFPVQTCNDPSRYDSLAREADVCILFYFWRRGIKIGAHFVTLHYCNDRFIGYNTYANSTGPDTYGPSLREFLSRRGYFATFLTAIRNKDRS